MDQNTFDNLLAQLLSADNTIRNAAESTFNQMADQAPEQTIMLMLAVVLPRQVSNEPNAPLQSLPKEVSMIQIHV